MSGQPPHGQDGQQVELRPSAANYWSLVAKRGIAFVVLIVVLLARSDSVQELVFQLLLCVAAAAVATGFVARAIRTCRAELAPGWIRYTRATGKHVVVDLSRARGILGKQAFTNIDLLVVVADDGTRLFRISADLWRPQDLMTIARLSGFLVDSSLQRAKDWEARLPGSTRFIDRHPFITGILLAIVIVAMAVLIAIAML